PEGEKSPGMPPRKPSPSGSRRCSPTPRRCLPASAPRRPALLQAVQWGGFFPTPSTPPERSREADYAPFAGGWRAGSAPASSLPPSPARRGGDRIRGTPVARASPGTPTTSLPTTHSPQRHLQFGRQILLPRRQLDVERLYPGGHHKRDLHQR